MKMGGWGTTWGGDAGVGVGGVVMGDSIVGRRRGGGGGGRGVYAGNAGERYHLVKCGLMNACTCQSHNLCSGVALKSTAIRTGIWIA